MRTDPFTAQTQTRLLGTVPPPLLAAVGASTTLAEGRANQSDAMATGASGQRAFHVYTRSQTFREAADHVLPSAVMIRTFPVLAERSHSRGPLPDEGHQSIPFGNLHRSPEFRRFFSVHTVREPAAGCKRAGVSPNAEDDGLVPDTERPFEREGRQ